jgi:asparagine synthase (glutamine-hydrolysing)
MTVIGGIAGLRPRDTLRRECRKTLEAQSLYSRQRPKVLTMGDAAFGAGVFAASRPDLQDPQPVQNGPAMLACDARIDNRSDLLSALSVSSLTENSSDSEILLAGWLRWGTGLFARVIGSFAIAVRDSSTGAVILARDMTSAKPLCYLLESDCIRFASMPSALLPDRPFAPNLPALARFLVRGDEALGETFFSDVHMVPPAHYLEWTPAGHRLVRFWYPPEVEESLTGDVLDEFRQILNESVRCRLLRLDGPVATHLSSGLDSSAITATAACLMQDPRELIPFTMRPAPEAKLSYSSNYSADESALAAQTAEMLGLEQRLVSHSGPLLDCLQGHGRFFQSPVVNVCNYGWYHSIEQQAAACGAKVMLSGTMGNATFSYGDVTVLSEWLRQGRLLEYFTQMRALVRHGGARWRGAIFYSLEDYIPGALRNSLKPAAQVTPANVFIQPEWFDRADEAKTGSGYNSPGLRKAQYDRCAHSDYGLTTQGTIGKSGIEDRDPAHDQRLVEFCLRLPAMQYLSNGVTRRLAREGLADRLPQSILRNRVRGLQGADWFAKLRPEEARNWIEEIEASPTATGLLDMSALRCACDNWDSIAAMAPGPLRDWGISFTSALAVGAFLREGEKDFASFGRRS